MESFFCFFVDVVRGDCLAVGSFGDYAADGACVKAHDVAECEEGGVFHFEVGAAEVLVFFEASLVGAADVAGVAVVAFLAGPEAVGGDGYACFEGDLQGPCGLF